MLLYYKFFYSCLKYYRAPRYRMSCVIIVLVERRCTGCKNKWSSLLENNVYLQILNGITICVMFVYAMPLAGTKTSNVLNASSTNCNSARARTERWNAYTKRDIENPNEYLSIINFMGDDVIKVSTQHSYIHSPVPKRLCKQGTIILYSSIIFIWCTNTALTK